MKIRGLRQCEKSAIKKIIGTLNIAVLLEFKIIIIVKV